MKCVKDDTICPVLGRYHSSFYFITPKVLKAKWNFCKIYGFLQAEDCAKSKEKLKILFPGVFTA